MYTKKIRDQIIEGLIDGDAVETLLQEKDKAAMLKCRGQEATKGQRAEIAGDPALSIRKTLVNPFLPNKTDSSQVTNTIACTAC